MANFKKYYFSVENGRYIVPYAPSSDIKILLKCFLTLVENESFRSLSWKVDDKHTFTIRPVYYNQFKFCCYIH